jgi:hypothetical protein
MSGPFKIDPEQLTMTAMAGLELLRRRGMRIVQCNEPLSTKGGEHFEPGTFFEVLRENADGTANLGEVDLTRPFWIGRTICGV